MTNKHQEIHHRIRMSAALSDWDEYRRIYTKLIEEAAKFEFNHDDEQIKDGGVGSGIGVSTTLDEE